MIFTALVGIRALTANKRIKTSIQRKFIPIDLIRIRLLRTEATSYFAKQAPIIKLGKQLKYKMGI